jgi:hypothetical protein
LIGNHSFIPHAVRNLFSDAAWQVVQNFNETATKQMALFGAIQKFGILM